MAPIATAVVTPTVHLFNLNALLGAVLIVCLVSPEIIGKKKQLILYLWFLSGEMLQILPKKKRKNVSGKNSISTKKIWRKKVWKLRLSKAVYLCAFQVFSMEWWIFRKIRLGLSCYIFNNSETNCKVLRKKEFEQIYFFCE